MEMLAGEAVTEDMDLEHWTRGIWRFGCGMRFRKSKSVVGDGERDGSRTWQKSTSQLACRKRQPPAAIPTNHVPSPGKVRYEVV